MGTFLLHKIIHFLVAFNILLKKRIWSMTISIIKTGLRCKHYKLPCTPKPSTLEKCQLKKQIPVHENYIIEGGRRCKNSF